MVQFVFHLFLEIYLKKSIIMKILGPKKAFDAIFISYWVDFCAFSFVFIFILFLILVLHNQNKPKKKKCATIFKQYKNSDENCVCLLNFREKKI